MCYVVSILSSMYTVICVCILVSTFFFFSLLTLFFWTLIFRYLYCPVGVGQSCFIYIPYNLFLLVLHRLFYHFGLIPRFDFFRRCNAFCYKSNPPISSRNAATLLVSMPVYLNVVLISVWLSKYCKVYNVS